jgi:hypothetical protein
VSSIFQCILSLLHIIDYNYKIKALKQNLFLSVQCEYTSIFYRWILYYGGGGYKEVGLNYASIKSFVM